MQTPPLLFIMNKRYIISIGVLFVIIFSRAAFFIVENNSLENNFVQNPRYTQYMDGTALDEMDFNEFHYLSSTIQLGTHIYRELSFPFDIKYYSEINNDMPSLVIPGNTKILATTNAFLFQEGYGTFSYPSYNKEWRFAIPFISLEELSNIRNSMNSESHEGSVSIKRLSDHVGRLYIKYEDLKIIAKYIQLILLTTDNRFRKIDVLTADALVVDRLLYDKGIFVSPALFKEPYDMTNKLLTYLAFILILNCFFKQLYNANSGGLSQRL
ncbi:MAG: hypothetical protein LBL09_02795 [Oscillospiraceae bacterium]|nr:hypothetical protein [Oscillospiraceae bacterium]